MEVSVVLEDRELLRIGPNFEGFDFEEFQVASAVLPNPGFVEVARNFGLNIDEFNFGDIAYCVAHKDLDFYPEPKMSRSRKQGSGAIYLAERDSGERSLLLQYLPPFNLTSRHYHKITTEYFHGLAGSCHIDVSAVSGAMGSRASVTLEGNTFEMKPGHWHQLRTDEGPSLALIEMVGNPEGLCMGDHYREGD